MEQVTIAPDHEHFLRGGKPFFWVGDTVWSAFTNPTVEEWREYLRYRKAQGFNVLQINTLPQWDRTLPDQGFYPYPKREDGSFDLSAAPNEVYWKHAREFCRMANEEGFTPALVLCWANIVPGTWLAKIFPEQVCPWEAVEQHIRHAVNCLDEFAPVYLVSGDTDLNSPETVQYYRMAFKLLKETASSSLRTMHLAGGIYELTPELAEECDFYLLQTGHWSNTPELPDELPARMRRLFPGKPVLNGEPCYEQMPKLTGRWDEPPEAYFSAEEVVDACRRSILAGARAGITYGANGLWNWCREGSRSNGLAAGMYGQPAPWREALHFPGAEKIGALAELAY